MFIFSVFIVVLVVFLAMIFLAYFNRIPKKPIINFASNEVIAPSYGKVIEIVRTNEKTTIKILLTITDVHVQYSPTTGILTGISHTPGNHNLILEQTSIGKTLSNEHLNHEFAPDCDPTNRIQVRQIAGKFARRCISFFDQSQIGQKIRHQTPIGRILFGSQVDLIIPAKYTVLCKKNDYVIGGETIIANYQKSS